MFYTSNILRNKINEAGKSNIPFLFGIDFEMKEGFFIPHPAEQKEVLYDVNGNTNCTQGVDRIEDFVFEGLPESYDIYHRKFEKVMQALQNGSISLANLTTRTMLNTNLELRAIFDMSRARYKLYVPGRFVCFSPECFVTLHDSKIRCYPMKGTISGDVPDAEAHILNDRKEQAEHMAAVELIIQDLQRVADRVHTKRFRYVDKLQNHNGTLLQVSSEVEGTLPDDYLRQLGDLLYALLPAGSIAGVPKEASLRVIAEAEPLTRGYYTGVFGYCDGQRLDSGVMIRFVEQENGMLYFRSGGGITIDSVCEKEYLEMTNKIYLPLKKS